MHQSQNLWVGLAVPSGQEQIQSPPVTVLPSSWMTALSSTLVKASSFTVGVAGNDVGKTASGVLRRSHQTSWTVETSVGVEVDCRENSLPDGIL